MPAPLCSRSWTIPTGSTLSAITRPWRFAWSTNWIMCALPDVVVLPLLLELLSSYWVSHVEILSLQLLEPCIKVDVCPPWGLLFLFFLVWLCFHLDLFLNLDVFQLVQAPLFVPGTIHHLKCVKLELLQKGLILVWFPSSLQERCLELIDSCRKPAV